MATISKTQNTSILSLQSVASGGVVVSSAQDVSTKLAATIFIHFGRRATAALTSGVRIRVEASSQSANDGYWFPLASFTTGTAAASSITPSGSAASGQKVISTTTTTGFSVYDQVYIDDTTIANSEWGRVNIVTASTSITLIDNLIQTHATTARVYNQAEFYTAQLDLTAIGRIRVVYDASNSGQATAIEVIMVTGDSIG